MRSQRDPPKAQNPQRNTVNIRQGGARGASVGRRQRAERNRNSHRGGQVPRAKRTEREAVSASRPRARPERRASTRYERRQGSRRRRTASQTPCINQGRAPSRESSQPCARGRRRRRTTSYRRRASIRYERRQGSRADRVPAVVEGVVLQATDAVHQTGTSAAKDVEPTVCPRGRRRRRTTSRRHVVHQSGTSAAQEVEPTVCPRSSKAPYYKSQTPYINQGRAPPSAPNYRRRASVRDERRQESRANRVPAVAEGVVLQVTDAVHQSGTSVIGKAEPTVCPRSSEAPYYKPQTPCINQVVRAPPKKSSRPCARGRRGRRTTSHRRRASNRYERRQGSRANRVPAHP